MTDEQIQAMLEAQAQAMGYDSIMDAVSYADEPSVPQFRSDGRRLRRWRSLVWAAKLNGTDIPPFEPVSVEAEPTPEQRLHNELVDGWNRDKGASIEPLRVMRGGDTVLVIPRRFIRIPEGEKNVEDAIVDATATVVTGEREGEVKDAAVVELTAEVERSR